MFVQIKLSYLLNIISSEIQWDTTLTISKSESNNPFEIDKIKDWQKNTYNIFF